VTGVIYAFTGFLPPLAIAATTDGASASTSFSGSFPLGNPIQVKWKLSLNGNEVSDLSTLNYVEIVRRSSNCSALSSPPPPIPIYQNGAPIGNSTFLWDATNHQFVLNADTAGITVKSCYRIRLKLNDVGTIKVTDFKFK
jgi:hypothetical protein